MRERENLQLIKCLGMPGIAADNFHLTFYSKQKSWKIGKGVPILQLKQERFREVNEVAQTH